MNDQLAYGMMTIGVLLIIYWMFAVGRRRKNRSAAQTTGRDHIQRARQKQGVRDELEALMVDINRMAKDLGAQLDAKIVHIERSVREADERIAQLQALRDSLDQPAAQPYAQPHAQTHAQPEQPPQVITPQRPPDQADPMTHEVYALADQGIGANDIAEQLNEHVGKVELILALRSG